MDIQFLFIVVVALGAFFIGYLFSPDNKTAHSSVFGSSTRKPQVESRSSISREGEIAQKPSTEHVSFQRQDQNGFDPKEVSPSESTAVPTTSGTLDYMTLRPGQIKATKTRDRGGKYIGGQMRSEKENPS